MITGQWVLHLDGPHDGDHLPVVLVAGRLPARVAYPEHAAGSDAWSGGPVVVRTHVYDLVDGPVGRSDAVYVYQDAEG